MEGASTQYKLNVEIEDVTKEDAAENGCWVESIDHVRIGDVFTWGWGVTWYLKLEKDTFLQFESLRVYSDKHLAMLVNGHEVRVAKQLAVTVR